MVATVPPATNYKPPIATALLIARSAAKVRDLLDAKRYWGASGSALDVFQAKMLRNSLDVMIGDEMDSLVFMLNRALVEAGETARTRRAAEKAQRPDLFGEAVRAQIKEVEKE